MSLINHGELKRQITSGELNSLDDITNEFKNILKEVIRTAFVIGILLLDFVFGL